MRNKTVLLTRTLIKNGEGLGIRGSSTFAKVMIILVFAIMVPMLMFGVSSLVAALLKILKQIGQEGVVLSWGIAVNSAIVFVFGIFYIISTFYFSSDIENLLPLPLKPRQIIGAKFLVVTFYEYLTTAVFFLPVWITYGVVMRSGFLYYLYGLIVYLLMPVTPLAIASVIIMIIMRFTNLSRYKDTIKVVGGTIGIFIGVGINLVIQNIAGMMSQDELMELLQKGNNSLVVLTSGIFPTARWGAEAMIYSGKLPGLLSLLIYAGFSLLIYAALLWLGQMIYLGGVVGLSRPVQKKSQKGIGAGKEGCKGSVIRTYTLTELRLLFRTPIYFLNCVLINFLWPVFLVLPMLFQPEQAKTEMMQQLSIALASPEAAGWIIVISFAAASFLGGSNGTTSTSISREGQELYGKKYLPVSYRQQLTAKVLSGFVLGLAAVIMMVLFAVLGLKLSPGWACSYWQLPGCLFCLPA